MSEGVNETAVSFVDSSTATTSTSDASGATLEYSDELDTPPDSPSSPEASHQSSKSPRKATYVVRKYRKYSGNGRAFHLIDGKNIRSALTREKWPPRDRRVSFPSDDGQLVTGYLEPANPWEHVMILQSHVIFFIRASGRSDAKSCTSCAFEFTHANAFSTTAGRPVYFLSATRSRRGRTGLLRKPVFANTGARPSKTIRTLVRKKRRTAVGKGKYRRSNYGIVEPRINANFNRRYVFFSSTPPSVRFINTYAIWIGRRVTNSLKNRATSRRHRTVRFFYRSPWGERMSRGFRNR